MKRPVLELRSWLQGHGINPEGFELVLVAPNDAKREEVRAAIMTDLSAHEATDFDQSGTVHGVAIAIESASRDEPGSAGRRVDRRRARY